MAEGVAFQAWKVLILSGYRHDFDGIAAAGADQADALSCETLQVLRVAVEKIGGVGADQGKSGSAMDAHAHTDRGRTLQCRGVLGATAGAGHHAFEHLSGRSLRSRGRSGGRGRAKGLGDTGRRADTGKEQRECKSDCTSE